MLNFIRKLLSKLYRKLGISADLGYIGTGVSLPPPLSKEEELRLPRCPRNSGAGEKHADRK